MPTQSQRQQHQQQQSVPQAGRKSVPAELLAQQHFERQLLERLEQHVRLTGELPYNEFYELAQASFERAQGLRQSKLPPRTVQQLSEQLDGAVEGAIYWARAVEDNLRELGACIQQGNDAINRESAVRDNINNSVRRLTAQVDFLLDDTDRYGLERAGSAPEGQDSDSSQSPQRLRKLKHDVRYLQRYVSEQGQVQTIKSELQPGDDSERYFRRLRRYLELLPDCCSDLGESLKLALQQRAATGQVAAPHRR
jgi:hypothetical protein